MRTAASLAATMVAALMLAGCGSNRIKQTAPIDQGITTNPSGLQWIDLKTGTGASAVTNDVVVINYTAWLKDGTVVETTTEKPVDFVLAYDNVIQGLHEAIYGMRIGGVRRVSMPAELAYGEEGKTPSIPPNSPLIAEITLTDIWLHPEATTPSGLKYWDRVNGEGDPPTSGDRVAVHYTGWLTDGTKFDSSLDRGQVFVFKLDAPPGDPERVIQGWNEGVSTMRPGGVRRLTIPPDLAYGETGFGDIPPNATLIFEVKLISVLPAETGE